MTASAFANAAYGPTAAGAQSPRETEYRIFARVTAALSRAQEAGDVISVAQAIYDNSRLWSTLAADVAGPGNRLPDELRDGLINLATFSQVHGQRVLAAEATMDALIDINRMVMKGLRPGAAAAA